jgi:hypothetical protein
MVDFRPHRQAVSNRRLHPGKGEDVNRLGSGIQQNPTSFVNRSARGQHVIDQKGRFALDFGGTARIEGKSLADVFLPFLPFQMALDRRGAGSLQRINENGAYSPSPPDVGRGGRPGYNGG